MTAAKQKLIIVESPAKARTISKFLGKGYKVEASQGHVCDLPKSQIGVDVDNDFALKYITIRGRGEILNRIRKEARTASQIYLATDPDREGEAISWHLKELLELPDDKTERVTFNEITKNVVTRSIQEPRSIDYNLVDAQQARRILDRIVGYQLSPLLWKKIRRGLSAGRVQSVATRLVVEREQEIEAFVPKEYWTIDVLLRCLNKPGSFTARKRSASCTARPRPTRSCATSPGRNSPLRASSARKSAARRRRRSSPPRCSRRPPESSI